jgi:group I intron endonuclease
MHIYKITNSVNGKIYIGKHVGENLCKYLREKVCHAALGYNHNPHLFSAIRKYGSENFVIESLVRPINGEQMDDLEKFFIRTEDSQNPDVGYNIAAGGEGGQGFKTTGMTGKKHKPETIALMKKRALERTSRGPHSEVTKLKMSLSRLGYRPSAEAVEKTRQFNLGKKKSEETKVKMSASAIARRVREREQNAIPSS